MTKPVRSALFTIAAFSLLGLLSACNVQQPVDEEKTALAIEPVATIEQAPRAPAAPAAVTGNSGEDVYKTKCFACHAAGVAGAPKFGNKTDWAPRIALGVATLHKYALEGIRAMPPKGGFSDLSDEQVQAAVDYMVEHAK